MHVCVVWLTKAACFVHVCIYGTLTHVYFKMSCKHTVCLVVCVHVSACMCVSLHAHRCECTYCNHTVCICVSRGPVLCMVLDETVLAHAYIHAYMHACMHIHINALFQIYARVLILLDTYEKHTFPTDVYACMYTFKYAYIHAHKHACMHAHMHAYIHKCIKPTCACIQLRRGLYNNQLTTLPAGVFQGLTSLQEL